MAVDPYITNAVRKAVLDAYLGQWGVILATPPANFSIWGPISAMLGMTMAEARQLFEEERLRRLEEQRAETDRKRAAELAERYWDNCVPPLRDFYSTAVDAFRAGYAAALRQERGEP